MNIAIGIKKSKYHFFTLLPTYPFKSFVPHGLIHLDLTLGPSIPEETIGLVFAWSMDKEYAILDGSPSPFHL